MVGLKLYNDTKKANYHKNNNVINIRGIRQQKLPYIYIWVAVYVWIYVFLTWWSASPVTEGVFSEKLRALIHIMSLVSLGIFIFVIRKEWFVKAIHMGSSLMIAGMLLHMTSRNNFAQLVAAVVIGVSGGLVGISLFIPFVFTLNNTEKLYAVVGSNVVINVILLLQEMGLANYFHNKYSPLLSYLIIAMVHNGIVFLKKIKIALCTDDEIATSPQFYSRLYLTLVFNCVFAILSKGLAKGILNMTARGSNYPVLMWYYIGGLFGCIIYVLSYSFVKKAFVWVGNITFGSLVMGLFCNLLDDKVPGMAVAFGILLGISSTVGMINMCYIIAVVGKKYNSMAYLKLSIIFVGIGGSASGIIMGNLIQRVDTFEMSMIASIIVVAVMLIILMISPLISQSSYYDDWAKDSETIEIDNEQLYMFKQYGLSKREIEVCRLLLQGYTMRQISAILSIAYPTVNTYCTSLYRKIGINSRTELMIIFKDYTVSH